MNTLELLYIRYIQGLEEEVIRLLELQMSPIQISRELGIPTQQFNKLYEHEEFIDLLTQALPGRKANIQDTLQAYDVRPNPQNIILKLIDKLYEEKTTASDMIKILKILYPTFDNERTIAEIKVTTQDEMKKQDVSDALIELVLNTLNNESE
jgi:hypothetical protein